MRALGVRFISTDWGNVNPAEDGEVCMVPGWLPGPGSDRRKRRTLFEMGTTNVGVFYV